MTQAVDNVTLRSFLIIPEKENGYIFFDKSPGFPLIPADMSQGTDLEIQS